jgi:DMSO/TMAO reductase YedYZ molybdopterin-dependent catalytic subunit
MIQLESNGYLRGSTLFGNEMPVRRVSLSPFLIDRVPVTNVRYKRFINQGGDSDRRYWSKPGSDHMKSALDRNAILAWQADDAPLTLETGFPLRLIDFGLFNYKCAKALQSIEVTRENKRGHREAHSGYDLDGTVQPKKYYAVDLQRKVWFSGTSDAIDEDL